MGVQDFVMVSLGESDRKDHNCCLDPSILINSEQKKFCFDQVINVRLFKKNFFPEWGKIFLFKFFKGKGNHKITKDYKNTIFRRD